MKLEIRRKKMKMIGKLSLTILVLLVFRAESAVALPTLQLDILDGYYDGDTETILTDGSVFTLYAYLTPKNNNAAALLADTYYLSAAITPQQSEEAMGDFGSFSLNGTSYSFADLVYGTPAIPSHGVFPTYFLEAGFNFDELQTATPYNTQDDPGLGPDILGSGMYYIAFDLDVSSLQFPYGLHFDLYSSTLGPSGKSSNFAPFSHDAGTNPIPEPATMLLFSTGLAGLAGLGLQRMKKK